MRVVVVIFFAVLPLLVDSQDFPVDSKPTEYMLSISVLDLAKATTFDGTVTISMMVNTPTNKLLLNAHNMTVSDAKVLRKSSFSGWVEEPISEFRTDNSLLIITFPQPIPTSSYKVIVVFKGHYQDEMAGFAKVGYSYNRTPRYLAVTRLEPTYARSLFPCFDVLGDRTNFVLDITVDNYLTVLSNVDHSYTNETDNNMTTYHFDSYPAMPVNQLALVVLELPTYITDVNNSTDIVMHTRAPYPYSNHTTWTTKVSVRILTKLAKYTEQNYRQKRIEQIVIPQFFTDSSEAWGLSSYSEEALLVTPGTTSTLHTQQVALGLSSGLARHWFGGLVSMNSWTHQWLMRGFAEYCKYIIPASLPEMKDWELKKQMVVEMVQPALALDTSQHALAFDTQGDPKKIQMVYDDLTKYKGGAIIRMLRDILGEDLFNKALVVYLKNSAMSTSEPSALWNMMYDAARESHVDLGLQSVEGILDTYVNTPGYPILNVTWNNTHYTISQLEPSRWIVPVSHMMQGSPDVINKTWLPPGGTMIMRSTGPQWIILNPNQIGYYRVYYQQQLLELILSQWAAEPNKLPVLSRAQLVDDVFHMMYNGACSPEFPLEFTSQLRHDSSYYSWHSALRNYQVLVYRLHGHSAYDLLQKHILELMEHVVDKVGLVSRPEDSHIDKLMRVMILEKACAYGHSACVEKAVSLLRSWMANTWFDPDLTSGLLCAAISNSSSEVWTSLWSMYKYSMVPSVSANILQALVCSRNVTLLNQFVTNITSTSAPVVNTKDKTILLQSLASTPFGAGVLLDWLIQTLHAQINGPESNTTLEMNQTENSSVTEEPKNPSSNGAPTDQQKLTRVYRTADVPDLLPEDDVKAILSYIAPMLTTLEHGAKIDRFVAMNNTGMSAPTLDLMRNVTRQIYLQADWAHKHNGPISVWLEKKASSTTPETPAEKPTPPPQSPTPAPPRPSGSSHTHCGLTLSVGLLVFVLHTIVMS